MVDMIRHDQLPPFQVPSFPVYTRSGEVTVSLDLLDKRHYSKEELEKLTSFHHFVFSSVLHLEKDPMVFSPEAATIGFLIVPLNQSAGQWPQDPELGATGWRCYCVLDLGACIWTAEVSVLSGVGQEHFREKNNTEHGL